MPKASVIFAVLVSDAKLPAGPMVSPRPGPTFIMAVAEPVILLTRSRPVIDKITLIAINEILISAIKEIDEAIISELIRRLL